MSRSIQSGFHFNLLQKYRLNHLPKKKYSLYLGNQNFWLNIHRIGGIPFTGLKHSEGKCLMEVSSLRFSLYSVRRVEKSYQPEDFSYLIWTKIGKEKVPALMIDQNEVWKHSSHIAVTHILAKSIIPMFLCISSCHFSLLLIKLSLILPQTVLSSDINWGIQQHRKGRIKTENIITQIT